MEASESSTESAAPWATPDEESGDGFAERPEAFVGAAFAGGLGVALLIRWLGSR